MSDLSTQIETLYRVIGQIRPASDSLSRGEMQSEGSVLRQAPQQGAFRLHLGAARPAGRNASVRWIFSFYCLWFSLPLSVWFSSGWIGLFFYWRALSVTARLVDWFSRKPSSERKERAILRPRGFTSSPFLLSSFPSSRIHASHGGASCNAIELEAR
jgi:hypothetical protein